MVPDVWSATVNSALITHCELLKDRFGIVDPRDGLDIEGIRSFREPIDTKYAAVYYPWLVVRNPATRQNIRVAPSAHMAGIYVRRLFLFVEESIDEGTQWVVFEPNDEPLWARVRQSVSNFLITVWRSGALEGATPDEAFFVTCDRTTMTQDDLDNGRLICLIG